MRRLCSLLVLAAGVLPTTHAAATSVSLEGPWRYHIGDDPGFSRPDLDDSHWETVELPEAGERGQRSRDGIVWYRKSVTLDRSFESPVLVLGGGVGTAREVWVDGRLLGAMGEVDGRPDAPFALQLVDLSADVLGDGELQIAVRTGQVAIAGNPPGMRWFAGPLFVGERELALAAADLHLQRRWAAMAPAVLSGFVVLGVAFFHLLVWRRRREQAAYLWYGVFLVGVGWQMVLSVRGEAFWPHLSMSVDAYLTPWAVVPLMGGLGEFVFAFFGFQRPRHWRWFWLLQTVAALVFVSPARTSAVSKILLAGNLAVTVTFTGMVLWRAIRGQRAARIVATGLALYLLSVLPVAWLGLEDMAGAEQASLGTVAGLLILVGAMAYALADHFASSLERVEGLHAGAARFVPTGMLEQLGRADVSEVKLGDSTAADMPVLFSDLRGFTRLSENLAPDEVFALVNRTLARIVPPIRAHGGLVDKYIGDAVLALFPSGAEDALRAAAEMQHALGAPDGDGAVQMGIGLHAGPMVLGTVGEPERIEATVISDTVNVASRLESATKDYGVKVLVSAELVARLPAGHDFELRRLGTTAVKGRTGALEVLELLDAEDDGTRTARIATREHFEAAVRKLEAGRLDAARAGLEAVRADDPGDEVAGRLLARLSEA